MKKVFFSLVIIFTLSSHSRSFGQVYTDEALYANGQKDYDNGDWQYAAVYLFALIQKNPQVFVTDASFKAEVTKAFDFAMTQLRSQVANSNQFLSQRSQPQHGVGSSQQGLGYKPPLRNTNTVKF